MIQLSEAALHEIRRLLSVRQQSCLRLSIVPGGCQDWRYQLELVNAPLPTDRVQMVQDVAIALPADQAETWQNLRLDYAEDLMGGSFRFQDAQVGQTCSCGQSFRRDRD